MKCQECDKKSEMLFASNEREQALIRKCLQLIAERDAALNRVDELERISEDRRYEQNTRDE